ncbi:hypothetical protein CDAR_63851 [Caerostris darwini]|uniref:Uncharacterized protein n=1 Tax=Caerostris darwini TaxID=1538125 RepID=A0AAV4N8K5_9ARAC|nr:hypothetical protein CDAR_63851 [Caerostris darwini]
MRYMEIDYLRAHTRYFVSAIGIFWSEKNVSKTFCLYSRPIRCIRDDATALLSIQREANGFIHYSVMSQGVKWEEDKNSGYGEL